MNIVHLKYATEIAKTGSINKAAENLYMAQPNLSRAIKELESSLGIIIFERTSKGMIPTADGEKLLQYAKKILSQVDELEKIFKEDHEDKLSFSICVPRASYVSKAFSNFCAKLDRSKKAEIFYKETNSQRTINSVLHSDYKLGIIRYAAQHDRYFKEMMEEKGLNYELVTEFSYVILMSKEHPLANKEDITFDDLAPYYEIAHADPYVPSLPLADVRKTELPDDAAGRVFVFERASQFELLSKNKDMFMWISPAQQDLLDRYGLIQKKCSKNTKQYKDLLIYKNYYHLSELDKKFITELCEAKREIMQNN